MHVKSGDKLMLAVAFQDFDGNAHEPSSYSVALWRTDNSDGTTVEVTPTLVSDAEGNVDGYHLYEYTTPSGDYTYFWRYYTTDTDVLAQEVSEVHYSGGWVDDVLTKMNTFNDSGEVVSNSSINSQNELTLTRGDLISQEITGIADAVVTASKIWVTVKKDRAQSDSDAIFQIEKSGGLLYLNGAAVTEDPTTKASISVSDDGDGTATVTFVLKGAQAAQLPTTQSAWWDVQYLRPSDSEPTTPRQGKCTIDPDVTKATS